jgi:DNA-directed RNA polymerase subunit RPC12/RpoP
MNKPYTCHNCGTTFESFPEDLMEQFNLSGQSIPNRIKVRCPGCYSNGFTSEDQMTFVLDITNDAILVN